MKYLLTGHTEPKVSKNGKGYVTLSLEGNNPSKDYNPFIQFKAIHFYDGEFPFKIGEWIELDIVEKNEQFFANKPKEKKAWTGGGQKGLSFDETKRLKSIELAVQLVIANKIEMKDLEKINKRLNELI
jgi:hypothetical protein